MGDFIWGIDVRSLSGPVAEVSKFQRFSSAWAYHAFHSMRRFNRTPIAPVMRRLLRMSFFTEEANRFYSKLTQDAVQLRLSGNGANRSDFMTHLLQLQAKGASADDLVGHALTVLMDGFETSAAVLYHLLYTVKVLENQQQFSRFHNNFSYHSLASTTKSRKNCELKYWEPIRIFRMNSWMRCLISISVLTVCMYICRVYVEIMQVKNKLIVNK